jgi:hypothetical protein
MEGWSRNSTDAPSRAEEISEIVYVFLMHDRMRPRGWAAGKLAVCTGIVVMGTLPGIQAGERIVSMASRVMPEDYAERLGELEDSIPVDLRSHPWPEEEESSFWRRAELAVKESSSAGRYGNTYFENEKRAYGKAMISVLGGYVDKGLEFLQERDHQHETWHRETLGYDFYAAFTIKHQMRKYFFFGSFLEEDYRTGMKEGARLWTEKDPLEQTHYAFTNTGVWGPDKQNRWVDPRSTDNLKLMRECAVFLFAEETGNEETAAIYKHRLLQFIATNCHFGMGEWDSENYLGHSLSPLLCLYDFAMDRQVRRAAREALDRICIDAALKYFHGHAAGPSRRDYNHPHAYGGSLACLFWLYFGDSATPKQEWESDEIHLITSPYRPPLAALHLARKKFPLPARLSALKADWASWKSVTPSMTPAYVEHSFISHSYQTGTLTWGTQNPDINGFKIVYLDSDDHAHAFWAGPSRDVTRLGSPQYQEGIHPGRSRVWLHDRSAVYLNTESDVPFRFVLPSGTQTEFVNGTMLITSGQFHAAVIPLLCGRIGPDDSGTRKLHWKEQRGEMVPRWPDLKACSTGVPESGTYGIIVHTGDRNSHGSFEVFRESILALPSPVVGVGEKIIEWRHHESGKTIRTPLVIGDKSEWLTSEFSLPGDSGASAGPLLLNAIHLRSVAGQTLARSLWGHPDIFLNLPDSRFISTWSPPLCEFR